MTPTTNIIDRELNTIDLELTEAELDLSNELQDEDLDRVVGGLQIHKLLDKASVKG